MTPKYLLKRLGQAILTFLVTMTVSFLLYQAMPGGPTEAMRSVILSQSGGSVDIDRLNRMIQLYTNVNPDQPMHVQYFNYASDVILRQDLGTSFFKNEEVTTLIMQRIPWSMFISVYALALGYSLSIFLGVMTAYREKSRFDSTVSSLIIGLNSIPYYIVGVVLVYFLAIQNNYFPTGGRIGSGIAAGYNPEFMVSLVQHAALPAISMGALATSGALAMRGNAIRVLGEDYIRVAQLRGLRETRIATQYLGHNSILPMYTQFMIGIAGVFSSAVIVEEVFAYPGMGLLMFEAVKTQDYPLLMGTLLVFTAISLTAIFIADLTYTLIDPRISVGEE
ncbi:ABC transporter permease [Haloferax sp. KTX1]|uniref:ABC transporter permease n=1 Tax=Haloferax sp. KTX1 TaxID=2600597 RepID=UPI001C9E7B07|nr:ABC transporter permease [Haloferax sp. KTX1]